MIGVRSLQNSLLGCRPIVTLSLDIWLDVEKMGADIGPTCRGSVGVNSHQFPRSPFREAATSENEFETWLY